MNERDTAELKLCARELVKWPTSRGSEANIEATWKAKQRVSYLVGMYYSRQLPSVPTQGRYQLCGLGHFHLPTSQDVSRRYQGRQ